MRLNKEQFDEAVASAVEKLLRGKDRRDVKEAEVDAFLKTHRDAIQDGLEDALDGIVWRIEHKPEVITKPVLEFKRPKGEIMRLWLLDAHERAYLAEHHSFHFGGDDTASAIYEQIGRSGHRAEENNLRNESTWEWVQRIMDKGMAAIEAEEAVKFGTGPEACAEASKY